MLRITWHRSQVFLSDPALRTGRGVRDRVRERPQVVALPGYQLSAVEMAVAAAEAAHQHQRLHLVSYHLGHCSGGREQGDLQDTGHGPHHETVRDLLSQSLDPASGIN